MTRHKLRVIVRPWQPRKTPYVVSQNMLKAFAQTHAAQFEEIVYLGWIRRRENGKRRIQFLVATGPTRRIAKQRFKESSNFGSEIWEIRPSTPGADQIESDSAESSPQSGSLSDLE